MRTIVDGEGDTWYWGVDQYGDSGYLLGDSPYDVATTRETIKRLYGLDEDEWVLVYDIYSEKAGEDVARAEGPYSESAAKSRRIELFDSNDVTSVRFVKHTAKEAGT